MMHGRVRRGLRANDVRKIDNVVEQLQESVASFVLSGRIARNEIRFADHQNAIEEECV